MLDMAFGLTDTSRLGCQVRLTRELDGMTATLPSATRNMFVDGARHCFLAPDTCLDLRLLFIREKTHTSLMHTNIFMHIYRNWLFHVHVVIAVAVRHHGMRLRL